MNTANNRRRRASRDRMERAFVQILQEKELHKITVSDVVSAAGVNRSTFYANYRDIYDLADCTRKSLENAFGDIFADYDYFHERTGALRMFTHIRENQIFYTTYFKLCREDTPLLSAYDPRRAEAEHIDANIRYHIEFFRNGLNAIIKLWLAGGCRETPEEMAAVLESEYRGR